MNRANPKFVLRNHLAQRAIERAEHKDFSEIERLRRILAAPYDEQPEAEVAGYAEPAPADLVVPALSCSS